MPPTDYEKELMEQIANLHIEKLPEGVYLATSEDIPGLVAQGRTITETVEIARDVARKLLCSATVSNVSWGASPAGTSAAGATLKPRSNAASRIIHCGNMSTPGQRCHALPRTAS